MNKTSQHGSVLVAKRVSDYEVSQMSRDEQIVTIALEGVRWTFRGACHDELKDEAKRVGASWTGDWWVFQNRGSRNAFLDFASSLDLEVCEAARMLQDRCVHLGPDGQQAWSLYFDDVTFRRAIAGHFHWFIDHNFAFDISYFQGTGGWVLETDKVGARLLCDWLGRRGAVFRINRHAAMSLDPFPSGEGLEDADRDPDIQASDRKLGGLMSRFLGWLKGPASPGAIRKEQSVDPLIVHGRRRPRRW